MLYTVTMTTQQPRKPRRFSRPVNVRLGATQRAECEAIARANHLSLSDVIRLSIIRGLPDLRHGQIPFEDAP